jgi:hypothetical protein
MVLMTPQRIKAMDTQQIIKSFLGSLKWDGTERFDEFCNCFDRPFTVATWLTGFIRRAYGENNVFPILSVENAVGTPQNVFRDIFTVSGTLASTERPTPHLVATKWFIHYFGNVDIKSSEDIGELMSNSSVVYGQPPQIKQSLAGLLLTGKVEKLPRRCMVVELRTVPKAIDGRQFWAELADVAL